MRQDDVRAKDAKEEEEEGDLVSYRLKVLPFFVCCECV